MEINTTAIVTAIIISALGGSGVIGFCFWWIKHTITKSEEALAETLGELKTRDNEQGKRINDLETSGFVKHSEIDDKLTALTITTAKMEGHMGGMASMAQKMMNQTNMGT